jgi:hypothetical protein
MLFAILYIIVSISTLILALVKLYHFKHGGSLQDDNMFISYIVVSIMSFLSAIANCLKAKKRKKK